MFAHSDMIWVAVESARLEGEHHLGFELPNLPHEPLYDYVIGGVDIGPRVAVGFPAGHARVPVFQKSVAL